VQVTGDFEDKQYHIISEQEIIIHSKYSEFCKTNLLEISFSYTKVITKNYIKKLFFL
jgi:hypothetical protein